MGIKYKRMGNYTADEKRQLEEAVGRHRLYLLAKHDYKRFESCVGADKAAEVLCDLKRTHRALHTLLHCGLQATFSALGVGAARAA